MKQITKFSLEGETPTLINLLLSIIRLYKLNNCEDRIMQQEYRTE